jgi:hypothetical protein
MPNWRDSQPVKYSTLISLELRVPASRAICVIRVFVRLPIYWAADSAANPEWNREVLKSATLLILALRPILS